MVSSWVRMGSGLRRSWTSSFVATPPRHRRVRCALASARLRATMTSSTRVRRSSLRSRSVVVGAHQTSLRSSPRTQIVSRSQGVSSRSVVSPDEARIARLTAWFWMEPDLSLLIAPDEAHWKSSAQLSSRRFVADSPIEPRPKDVQFCFRHGALESQQEPVLEQCGVVKAVANQGVGHPTQVHEPIPVGVVAGESGDFQSEYNSDSTRTTSAAILENPELSIKPDPVCPRSSSITTMCWRIQPSVRARSTRWYCRSVDSGLRSSRVRVD